MKEVFKKYLNNKIKLDKYQKISIFCLVVVISGSFGWLYEYIFYYFNFGMTKFYWQGGNFLPWINIYAIGAVLVLMLTHKYKNKPLKVFLISVLSTGLLEYFTGLAIYKLQDGLRYWDYNTEILNFGNIGGFVCLRSVLFFGISALLLVYLILPLLIYLSKKINIKTFLIISIALFSIVLFDEFYNLIITKITHTPRARDVYESIGIEFMEFNK